MSSCPDISRLGIALILGLGFFAHGCSSLSGPMPVSSLDVSSAPLKTLGEQIIVERKPTGTLRQSAHIGEASWYGPGFTGRKTASGDIFDNAKLTAAHRTIPLGSRAKVTNLANGKTVEVEINDRGPFIEGRIIDLSQAAAKKLGMIDRGTARVQIELAHDLDLTERAQTRK